MRCLALPPVSPTRLAILEQQALGLPAEVTELLSVTAGLRFGEHALNFAANIHVTEAPPPPDSPWRLFPRRLDLGTASDGGRYIVDLSRPQVSYAPVFELRSEPPIITMVASSLAGFLVDVARAMPVQGNGFEWDFDPFGSGYKSKSAATRSSAAPALAKFGKQLRRAADPILTAYAANLPSRTGIIDLRTATPGRTFDWASKWRVDVFYRHPSELIFGLTVSSRRWRPISLLLGRPSARERRRRQAAFRSE